MASPLAKRIDAFLKAKGSPLAGHGDQIVAAAQKYYRRDPGLLARLIVGISGSEQTYGTTGNADVSQYHNAWGYGHPPSGLTSRGMFSSWGQGIDTVARALAGVPDKTHPAEYLSAGLTRPEQLYGRWVKGDEVSTAARGGYSAPWIGTVTDTMRQLGGAVGNPAAPPPMGEPPAPPVSAPLAAPPAFKAPPPIDFAPYLLQQLGRPNYSLQPLMDFVAMQQQTQQPAQKPAAKPVTTLQTPAGKTFPVVSDVKGPLARKASAAIKLAEEYLGTPYSWGGGGTGGPSYGTAQGANIKGFDCSSLLQYVWAKQGVNIPRVTYTQWTTGRAVSQAKLQPGDAVFFHMGSQGPEHVGMYIGGGQFIHAPHTGDVIKISKLAGYGGYVGARRFA